MYKTEVCKKNLNPRWNSDWYRFEVGAEISLLHDLESSGNSILKCFQEDISRRLTSLAG